MERIKKHGVNGLHWLEQYLQTDMVYVAKSGFWLTVGQVVSVMLAFGMSVFFPGDLNSDGKVNISDYSLLLQHFGNTTCGNTADIDGNCKVDIFDYNILVMNFGK